MNMRYQSCFVALALLLASSPGRAQTPTPAKAPTATSELFRVAELAYQKAEWQEALIRFEAIAELLPADPTAFFKMGLIHQQTGQLDQSLTNYGRASVAVKLQKTSPELTELEQKIRFNRSTIYMMLARADLAAPFDQLDAKFTETSDRQSAQLDKLLGTDADADRVKKATSAGMAGTAAAKKDPATECAPQKATSDTAQGKVPLKVPAKASVTARQNATPNTAPIASKLNTQTPETFVGGGLKK